MTLAESGKLEPGTELFGYHVLGLVAEGASAYVYRAEHPELPILVAIKQLRPESIRDANKVERFLNEARTVSRLKHRNVVVIYDLKHDEETGMCYIFTEFAEKGTLADRLEKSPEGLPVDEVIHLAIGICDGLEAVHRKGILHDDIKPSNILLFEEGADRDEPKLTDFGIATAPVVEGAGIPKSIYGSIHYMAPERLTQDKVDCRSDLYSLGISLYEVLTGHVPFNGENERVYWAHIMETPTPPRELRPDIRGDLEEIVLQALRKRPEERYRSAADMGEALRAIADAKVRKERRHRFDVLLEQGEGHLEKGDWRAAIETLQQASPLEPGDERVLQGLETAKDQQRLEELYHLGVQQLGVRDWENAEENLTRVVECDPDYADGQAREQLSHAIRESERERKRRTLAALYRIGMVYFGKRQWKQAISELQQVYDQDPEFEDTAERLRDAQKYVHAGQLVEEAQLHKERREWERVVELLEEVEQIGPPHVDVAEELRNANRKRAEAKQERQIAEWYLDAEKQLRDGYLEQAQDLFERVYNVQADYRDVVSRLQQIKNKLHLDQLYQRAYECEEARNWLEAIQTYEAVLGIEPYSNASGRLLRAQRCAKPGIVGWVARATVRMQHGWNKLNRNWKIALAGLLIVAILVLVAGVVLVARSLSHVPAPTSTATPPSITVPMPTAVTPTPMPTSSPKPTLAPTFAPFGVPSKVPPPTATHTAIVTDTPTAVAVTTTRLTPYVATVVPSPYPTPVPEFGGIIRCDVTFRWQWSRTLGEDEYFAVRVWREGIDKHESKTWTKEDEFICTLSEKGEYSWEIAVCQGDPSTHICNQMAVSERGIFSFNGCNELRATPIR